MGGKAPSEVSLTALQLEAGLVSADLAAQSREWEFLDLPPIETAAGSPDQALRRLVLELGERNLLGWVLRGRDGGQSERVRSEALCLLRERLGYASPMCDLAFAMQGLGSFPITLAGNEEQRVKYLPGVAAGTRVMAFALTEPDAGTDLSNIALTATKDGDSYLLSGTKTFISNATVADTFTLFAATKPLGERGRLTAFVVDGRAEGLTRIAQSVLGDHPIGTLTLDKVRVEAADRLGDEGQGMRIALGTLSRFRTTVGAAALGFAARAVDEAVKHVNEREQFGAPLSALVAVQQRVAEMVTELDAARLLVYRAALAADREDPMPRDELAYTSSMAKMFATEAAQRITDSALQLHGGRGVLKGTVIARLYEDVRALRIYEGTTDVHKVIIARHALSRGLALEPNHE